jgi:hypothetical protein
LFGCSSVSLSRDSTWCFCPRRRNGRLQDHDHRILYFWSLSSCSSVLYPPVRLKLRLNAFARLTKMVGTSFATSRQASFFLQGIKAQLSLYFTFFNVHASLAFSITSLGPLVMEWVLDSQTFSIKHNQAGFPAKSNDINCVEAVSQHILNFFTPSSASSTSRFHDMVNSGSVDFPTYFLPSFQPRRDQPCRGQTLLRN